MYTQDKKFGQKLQGSELKTLLALLMLAVGVLMAYDTFFRNGTPSINIPTDKIVEISEFGNTIFNLSTKYPIVYGVSSIFLALVAGVAVSFIRRQISKRINKPAHVLMNATLSIAFLAGLISFLSPCVLPLIPGYISYISGTSFDKLVEKEKI